VTDLQSLLTLRQVADLVALTPQTVLRQHGRGSLPAGFKLGSEWRWKREAIEKWLQEDELGGAAQFD
jgi:excisionase family DNA binding protein